MGNLFTNVENELKGFEGLIRFEKSAIDGMEE